MSLACDSVSNRCTLDPGDKILDCPPTFTMYAFDAAVNGASVIKGGFFPKIILYILLHSHEFWFTAIILMFKVNPSIFLFPFSYQDVAVLSSMTDAISCLEDFAVPRLPGFALDVPSIVDTVRQQNPKIVFLTSPNNPDGW